MSDHILAVTTVGDEPTAVRLAHALLERRLVACVNVVARIRSFYHWKGAIEEDDEQLLLMKTREECFDALRSAFDELHPLRRGPSSSRCRSKTAPPLISAGWTRTSGLAKTVVAEEIRRARPRRTVAASWGKPPK